MAASTSALPHTRSISERYYTTAIIMTVLVQALIIKASKQTHLRVNFTTSVVNWLYLTFWFCSCSVQVLES